MRPSTFIVADSYYKRHLTGPGHPECPARYDIIIDALSPLNLPVIKPREALIDEVLLCHSKSYYSTVVHDIHRVKSLGIEDGSIMLSTGDASICPKSLQVALRAAGGVLNAVEAVCNIRAKSVFCVVRPPGHHATTNQGMGFCIFNNVAIGARYAQETQGIERVLIVDWDVHHGNGTQEIFEADPSVFYFSTHQWPLYPGTGNVNEIGSGPGKGTTLNCPIAAGSHSREEVLKAFREKLVPAMEKFQPELVMISAGFDAHEKDPLGGFNLTDEDFAELTRIVKGIAEKYAGGKIVSVLEGGYNLTAIGGAAKAHVSAL